VKAEKSLHFTNVVEIAGTIVTFAFYEKEMRYDFQIIAYILVQHFGEVLV
jgi:hypothetical protein